MSFLENRLAKVEVKGLLRTLPQWEITSIGIDFCSNDYLGLARRGFPTDDALLRGATGSRLISGNCAITEAVEQEIATFHKSEAALLFNSGYEANMGLIGALVQKGSFFLYDAQIHRSVREALRGSVAPTFPFQHNNPEDLKKKIELIYQKVAPQGRMPLIFVIIESVYSMDGSRAPMVAIMDVCTHYQAYVIVDEAHATGVIGASGEGVVQELNAQDRVLARVHTFGKALGLMGAVVVGSAMLKKYLINFAPSFIYTTAMPALMVRAIRKAYQLLPMLHTERTRLAMLIRYFQEQTKQLILPVLPSATPIQAILCPGNDAVQKLAATLQNQGIGVQAIRSPTVAVGKECLRIILHTFNTEEEIRALVRVINESK